MKRAPLPTWLWLAGATAVSLAAGCGRDARAHDGQGEKQSSVASPGGNIEGKTTVKEVKRVSPQDAKALLEEGYTYVDVRSEPEFLAGHPKGSVNVPFLHMTSAGMTPNPEFMDVMTKAFPKDAKIVLGCRSGGRSLKAAELMQEAGFTNVVDQRAGFEGARGPFGNVAEQGWAPANLPVEEGATPGQTYEDVKKRP